MLKKVFFTIFLLAGISILFADVLWAGPAEVSTDARILGITVYPDRALIRKEAVCSVERGNSIVSIPGLTPQLIDESVQVSLEGKSTIRILDVKVEQTHLRKVHRGQIQTLQDRLNGLNNQIRSQSDEVAAINGASDFLKRVTPFSQNQKTGTADVERYARFLEKSLRENAGRAAGIESGLRKLQEEKKAVESELAALSASQDPGKTVVVYLESTGKNTNATLKVSYVATGAGWSPHYEVRADSNKASADISTFALIRQSTGEDWKDASIELSTAKPSVGGIPPELSAWNLDVYHPRPIRYKAAPGARPSLMAEMDAAAPAPAPEGATVETQATSVSFVLPRRSDVPSDGQPHRVLIASSSKDTAFEYFAVPKLSSFAYLRANLRNPFSYPMLSGSMSLYLDGRFVNSSSLARTVVPDEKMDLSFGVDEGIRIERKLKNKQTEYGGVISKEEKVSYEFTLDVTNGKEKEISFVLVDQFPVSRNEQIRIHPDLPKVDSAQVSDEGIITWRLTLAPHEKKSLKVAFRVEYPKDLRITGLE